LAEGSWYLGTSLYGLKRYPEARDAFRHLALSQPGNGPAWALAGMCEFELKEYPRAQEYLLRAESTGLGGNEELSSLVRFRIALLLNRSGDFKQARDRLLPIAAAGTYPEVIEAMGLNLLRAPLLPAEIPEQDRDLYMRAGEAMNAKITHDSEGAARLFDELVTAYPDRPNVHFARGASLMESAPDQAMLEFQHELQLNPSDPGALLELAELSLKQESTEKAVSYARRAVKANPAVPVPHRVLVKRCWHRETRQAQLRNSKSRRGKNLHIRNRTFSSLKRTRRPARISWRARKWRSSNAWTENKKATSARQVLRSSLPTWRWLAPNNCGMGKRYFSLIGIAPGSAMGTTRSPWTLRSV